MTRAEIIEWLQREFKPLRLATPDETLSQVVENSYRYWNTHSGYKISKMFNAPGNSATIQLDPDFKNVVSVYPNAVVPPLVADFPTTLLLGMTILDNVTTDMIILSEAFKTYKRYVGSGAEFQWWFNKSEDPEVGGKLYYTGLPKGADKLFVVGTKRVRVNEDIKQEYILDWILRYSKAQLKMIEGNTLRKSDIIGIKNDGQALVDEGKEEMKELQEQLFNDGRWVALAKRA